MATYSENDSADVFIFVYKTHTQSERKGICMHKCGEILMILH